jgi:hypothetical protein
MNIDKLNMAIMNILCKKTLSHFATVAEAKAYGQGHRAARHAAVELLLEYFKNDAEPSDAPGDERALPVELMGVREEMASGSGFWQSCSGCHDTEDGHPTGPYTYSQVFGCALGSGCSECGGIGAVWDNTDYEAMASDLGVTEAVGSLDQCKLCGGTGGHWSGCSAPVDTSAALASPAVSQIAAPDCVHVWNDFGQLGGRNVSWCPRCDTLAWTGKEPATQQAVSHMDGAAVEMPGMWEPADVSGGETDMPAAPSATTASASVPHHVLCPQKGYNQLCTGCEAEREATTASASEWDSALEAAEDTIMHLPFTSDEQLKAFSVARRAISALKGRTQASSGLSASTITPWEDRTSQYETAEFSQIERMKAEIADLRAALAQQGASHAANAGDVDDAAIRTIATKAREFYLGYLSRHIPGDDIDAVRSAVTTDTVCRVIAFDLRAAIASSAAQEGK